jgi:hypothetical protein
MFTDKKKTSITGFPRNTTHQLNQNNPYILVSNEDRDTNTSDSNEILQIYIPDYLLDRALQLEQYDCTIKLIILTDIFMSCLYFINNIFLGMICLMISINGYFATIWYKKSLMTCYIIYQYLQVFGRFLNLIVITTWPKEFGYSVDSRDTVDSNVSIVSNESIVSNKSTSSTSEFYVLTQSYIFMIFVYFVLFCCQFIIASFVTKYYKLLPTNNEREKIRHYLPS